jgi:hypothetical protein
MGGDRNETNGAPPLLLRLMARCPACGSAPALRIAVSCVSDAARHEPGEPLATYQCQRRRCGTVYVLTARAFQRAS